MNLFESVRQTLNEEIVAHIAKTNQETPDKINKVIDGLSVSLVVSLLKRVTTESGMNSLYRHVQQVEFLPEQIGEIIQNPSQLDSFKTFGDKTLNIVTPGVKSPISIIVSKYSSTRTSTVSSLSGVVFSTILSILKRQVQDKKWNAESLTSYMGDQREPLLTIAPDLNDTMIDALGAEGLLKNFVAPRIETSAEINRNSDTNEPFIEPEPTHNTDMRSYLKWLMLGLAIIGLAATGYYFWNNYEANQSEEEVAEEVTVATTAEAKIVAEPIMSDSTQRDSVVVPTTATSTVAQSDMEKYLTDTTAAVGKVFEWKETDFTDNTAQLKSENAVATMVELLKKYPNAQIKIIGYANDAQLPNTHKALSVKRVVALKDLLIKAGINFIRIDAEGLGTGVKPANATTQKPMRAIYIKFVKK